MVVKDSFLRRSAGWLMLLGAAFSLPAHAGRSCEAQQPPQAQTVVRSLALAERTLAALEASGQRVVLLARAGQDLSKYGVVYSHVGFAYQEPVPGAQGKGGHVWRVLHKLNQSGTAEAAIYRQGLGEFFLDDLWRFEAAWVVPTPAVQDKLLPLLLDAGPKGRALSLHTKPYSIVSYAWGTKYQQSNQWAIETLAAAVEPQAKTREQAQAWLKLKAYQPAVLRIGPLTRMGGRMSAANVAFDDHPNDKRFADRIETITVDSVFQWMQGAGLSGAPVILR